ncbi:MAG: ATP-binding protein [Armatimonadota bacterium]
MELAELALSNFKRFADADFRFAPGLNVIWGENEAGKSTVHEAICCALFGRERGRSVERWGGGTCAVSLAYKTGDRSWLIERKLTEGSAVLCPAGGEVVTSKERIAELLAEHIGLTSRAVFESTLSVQQMSVGRIGSELEAVGHEIQAVFTGAGGASAGDVYRRLETKRDSIKGRARPANPREYDKIADRLRGAARELAGARHSRDQIRNLEEEQAHLDARLERDSARLAVLAELLERHRRWSELKRQESELDGTHEAIFAACRRIKETLEELRGVQSELQDYAVLVGEDEKIAADLTKLDVRRHELEARLDEIDSFEAPRSRWAWLAVGALLAAGGLAAGLLVHPFGYLLILPGAACLLAGRRRGSKLSGFADSARGELQHLTAEEESVLSYVGCRDSEEAWLKIKKYRALAAAAHDLEVNLEARLEEKSLQDWESEESGLARELSGTQAILSGEFPDYSPSTAESESWRTEHASLCQSLANGEARLHEVRGSLASERRNARDLAALEGEIEYLHARKAELDFMHRAYEEAINALSAVTHNVSTEYLPVLCEQASGYMGKVTAGRYTVAISPGWEIALNCAEKSDVNPQALSAGTLDQLYLSLRISCTELLSAGRKLPLFLDDPFASFDRPRLERVLELLSATARERQVLLFTHDPYILEWAGKNSCMVHSLT